MAPSVTSRCRPEAPMTTPEWPRDIGEQSSLRASVPKLEQQRRRSEDGEKPVDFTRNVGGVGERHPRPRTFPASLLRTAAQVTWGTSVALSPDGDRSRPT